MADQQPLDAAAGKKKRRVKKKTTETQAEAAPIIQRPTKKPSLTFEDRQHFDYIREATSKNVWYYRDRLSVPRGPCNLPVLRECWVQGVIDEGTLVWGQGLADWLPIRNVRTLVPQIRTMEVQVATWIKRQFALKPAIARIRRERAPQRPVQTAQIDNMY
ncbi:g11530 [Coccomyxa elongata]